MSNFWKQPFPVSKKLGTTELKLLKNLTLILVLFLVRYFSTLTLNKVKVCRKVCSYKKKSKNNIFVFICFSTEFSDVSCPITFLTFKNFFFSKRIWKKKKKLGGGLEPQDRTRTHRTYKHSYSILCHTGLGVPKTISPVVKTLTKVSVSSPPTKVVPIGTSVTIISVAVKSCNRRVGNPQNPVP